VTAESLYQFAIPVSKKIDKHLEPIRDEYAHFNWYKITIGDDDFPNTVILYRNQFTGGEKPEKLVIGKPVGLLLPAEKIEKGSKFPDNLDHYLCYEILKRSEGAVPGKHAGLKGQFTNVTPFIVRPHFFCVPCSKDNKKIKNEKDHFVIYLLEKVEEFPEKEVINAKDQWGELTFIPKKQNYFMVPSEKDKVSKSVSNGKKVLGD
jgi:hypothetical protein